MWYTESVKTDEVNAKQRVARRITARLDELGWTQQYFADQLGHKGNWVSALKQGKFALSLEELDTVAHLLKLTPGDLTRADDDPVLDLRPSERRLLHAVRELPPPIRDHMILLSEYLIGVAPDEIGMLQQFRRLTPEEQARIGHWIDAMLDERARARARPIPADPPQASAPPTGRARRTRAGR
jgi:transcriptional regulator with XRE-family HTH domain